MIGLSKAAIISVLPGGVKQLALPPAAPLSPTTNTELNTPQRDKIASVIDLYLDCGGRLGVFFYFAFEFLLLIFILEYKDAEEYLSKFVQVLAKIREKMPWFREGSGKPEAGRVIYVNKTERAGTRPTVTQTTSWPMYLSQPSAPPPPPPPSPFPLPPLAFKFLVCDY